MVLAINDVLVLDNGKTAQIHTDTKECGIEWAKLVSPKLYGIGRINNRLTLYRVRTDYQELKEFEKSESLNEYGTI